MAFFSKKIIDRTSTNVVKVKDIPIGGYNNIVLQSMTNTKTSDVIATLKQIDTLVRYGAQIVRVSVLDIADADALSKICSKAKCPIVADIHYNYKFALKAIEAGVGKIRINPGNMGDDNELKQIVNLAKSKKVAIRIGLNGGSAKLNTGDDVAQQLVNQALNYIYKFESWNFKDIIVSIKHSSPQITIEANELLAKHCYYPIHLGVTEAGDYTTAIIKSVIALTPLIEKGIGSTIRISINSDPHDELVVLKKFLKQLGLYPNYPNIIACPLCGRNKFNTSKIVKQIDQYLGDKDVSISVAIMGCGVNGPGESKHANLAVCVNDETSSSIYVGGVLLKDIKNTEILDTLITLIDKIIKENNNG